MAGSSVGIPPNKRKFSTVSPNDSTNKASHSMKQSRATGSFTKDIDKEFKSFLQDCGKQTPPSSRKFVPNLKAAMAANALRPPFESADSSASKKLINENTNEEAPESVVSPTSKVNDSDWQLPKTTSQQTKETVKTFTTENLYEILKNLTDEEDSQNDNEETHTPNPVGKQQSQRTQNTPNNNTGVHAAKKQPRPPPIFCNFVSSRALITVLKNHAKKANFIVKEPGQGEQITQTATQNDFYTIKNNLKDLGVEYITYSMREEKNKLLVLKGLYSEYTEEEVQHVIRALNLPDTEVVKVTKLLANKNNQSNLHFLVQLTPQSNPKELSKVTALDFHAVRWEPYRRNKIFQCYRCQRVGHSSRNCNLKYRCVKCTDEHEPTKCPKNDPANKTTLPSCVNCGAQDHPANYRGCPFIKFAQGKLNELKENRRNQRLANSNQIDNQRYAGAGPITGSWSEAVRGTLRGNETPPPRHAHTAHALSRGIYANSGSQDMKGPFSSTNDQPHYHQTTAASANLQPGTGIDIVSTLLELKSTTQSISHQNNIILNQNSFLKDECLRNSQKIKYLFEQLDLVWE